MNIDVYFAAVRELRDQDLGLLAADERQRAGRFRFEADRRRFVLARCAVRLALARAIGGVAPAAVPLRVGPHGKPELASEDRLAFSLSHAGEYIALALARERRRVGIDLEQHQRVNVERIAQDHFCPREVQWLREGGEIAVDVDARFNRIWTLKEAYLKACGLGLAGAPSSVDVSEVMRSESDSPQFPRGKSDIAVQSIEAPAAGYSAALAADGCDWRSRVVPWDWDAAGSEVTPGP